MAWSPAARAAAAAARKRRPVKQASPGGFTSKPQHAPAVTGMGVAKHGVATPHSQAPHVLPPDNITRQVAHYAQHGPPKGFKTAAHNIDRTSIPKSGVKRPPKPKKVAKYMSDHDKWKASWGMGAG